MKILLVVDAHFKEYGGPHTAISQKIEFLNKKKIINKLIFRNSNTFKFNLDIDYIIRDFDIVHIYGIWRPYLAKIFYKAKKLKKKIVISPIGSLEPWAIKQKWLKKKIAWHLYQKKILNSADALHATSEIEANNFLSNNVGKKIVTIGHGIDVLDKKDPIIKTNKEKKLIFFSRIHEKKGLLELINIWKSLKNKDNWKLDIYGPISNENYFKKILLAIKKNNLEKQIKYLDSVFNNEHKQKIFFEANAFILPSKSENFGISIGEALSYGLPVLTTFQTPWKIINNYNAGIVFDFSEKNILNSLDQFMSLKDGDHYKMSLNAINLIKENFESNKILNQYVELYKSLLV